MGEAKRRQKLDPEYGKPQPPVKVKVERSKLTEKWLCVAYILGKRYPISPHIKYDDAIAAALQVNSNFNRISADKWKQLTDGSDDSVLIDAIATLDYEDDDEIIGIGQLLPDGRIHVDSDIAKRQQLTEEINQFTHVEGKSPLFIPPTHK